MLLPQRYCRTQKQEKLRLDMDDEAAVEWMQQLLNESATALMPQIMETTHKVRCR
jgi:phosphatidylinositol 3-kinase